MTTKEIMAALGIPENDYDTTKPQPWMDAMRENGFDYQDLYLNYVWLYDEQARISGRPFNYMAAYCRMLIEKYEALEYEVSELKLEAMASWDGR